MKTKNEEKSVLKELEEILHDEYRCHHIKVNRKTTFEELDWEPEDVADYVVEVESRLGVKIGKRGYSAKTFGDIEDIIGNQVIAKTFGERFRKMIGVKGKKAGKQNTKGEK